jgi:hypothetical protein
VIHGCLRLSLARPSLHWIFSALQLFCILLSPRRKSRPVNSGQNEVLFELFEDFSGEVGATRVVLVGKDSDWEGGKG